MSLLRLFLNMCNCGKTFCSCREEEKKKKQKSHPYRSGRGTTGVSCGERYFFLKSCHSLPLSFAILNKTLERDFKKYVYSKTYCLHLVVPYRRKDFKGYCLKFKGYLNKSSVSDSVHNWLLLYTVCRTVWTFALILQKTFFINNLKRKVVSNNVYMVKCYSMIIFLFFCIIQGSGHFLKPISTKGLLWHNDPLPIYIEDLVFFTKSHRFVPKLFLFYGLE